MTRNTLYLALAAASTAGLAGLGFATAGVAHPHPDSKTHKVIILDAHEADGKHKGAHADGDRKRRIRTVRVGPGMAHCDGERREIDGGDSADGKKTRIIICSKGGDSAGQAERLERALERVQANDHLDGEHKEKVVAALREALDRLRAGP